MNGDLSVSRPSTSTSTRTETRMPLLASLGQLTRDVEEKDGQKKGEDNQESAARSADRASGQGT